MNEQTQHIKGPWKVVDWRGEAPNGTLRIEDSDGFVIAKIEENAGQEAVNAQLIGAAPELLKGLTTMLVFITTAEWTQHQRLACIYRAKAAVAKALKED